MERYPSRARNATALADKEKKGIRNLTNPVVFVGARLRDFANGRVRLKFRVTCYSSHHYDSLGFRYAQLRNQFVAPALMPVRCCRLTFTMANSRGRVVGRGSTPPILVIDARKIPKNTTTLTQRNKRINPRTDIDQTGECTEPLYKRHCRTPATSLYSKAARSSSVAAHSPIPQIDEANYSVASLPQAPADHPDSELLDTSLGDCLAEEIRAHTDSQSATHPRLASGTPPVTDDTAASNPSQLVPYIESIAPSSGSTLGGTWVYVIGTNFRPDNQILFGGVLGKTVYWSETALRCQAPPSEKPVSVAISISGIPLEAGGVPGDTRFTYEDSTEYELYVDHTGTYIASSNNGDLFSSEILLRCVASDKR